MSQQSIAPRPLVSWIATFAGAGLLPKAPGTWGSLATLPWIWFLWRAPLWTMGIATIIVSAVGIWAADQYILATGKQDNQEIVIDEVAGMLVTAFALRCLAMPHPWHLLAVFVAFRIADITKPFPARWADRNWKGGLGCMADDLLASLWSAAVVCALQIFWWGK